MKIVEMNAGTKVDYELNGYKLTFNDELTIRLDKYQRDYEVVKDIMADNEGFLVIGDGRFYVAQVVIPETQYDETVEMVEKTEIDPESGEEVTKEVEEVTRTKIALNTDDVELRLFSIDGMNI